MAQLCKNDQSLLLNEESTIINEFIKCNVISRIIDQYVKPEFVTLKTTRDNKEIKIQKDYMQMSNVFKIYLEANPKITTLDIHEDVSYETLEKIVEYINHHEGVRQDDKIIEMPLKSLNLASLHESENFHFRVNESKFDIEFLDKNWKNGEHIFYEIIRAANDFGISCLIHLCSAKIAVEQLIAARLTIKQKSIRRSNGESGFDHDYDCGY
jgi:hypothetical protein